MTGGHPTGRRVIVVNPHGFCSGVARAIEMIEAVAGAHPGPVYCFNEIVHNRQIVDGLVRRGVVFVDSIDRIPVGATVLFSAHGVTPAVRREAETKRLRVADATCPFVSKVHNEVRRFASEGFTILLIGHRRHEEVVGVGGEAPEHVIVVESVEDARAVRVADDLRVAVVTQTTLSPDMTGGILAVLRERFPGLRVPAASDICYATQNRQQAIRALAKMADAIIVLGSRNSSNSRRLVETGNAAGCRTALVSELADLDAMDLAGVGNLGVTSGASTPESFLREALERLALMGFGVVKEHTAVEEKASRFPIPDSLRAVSDVRREGKSEGKGRDQAHAS